MVRKLRLKETIDSTIDSIKGFIMGRCKYCGEPTGIPGWSHIGCWKKFRRGLKEVRNLAKEGLVGSMTPEEVKQQVDEVAESCHIKPDKLKPVLVEEWANAVNHFLEDSILDEEEEDKLTTFAELFGLSQDDLNQKGAYTTVVKAAVLRDLINGVVPQRVNIVGNLPFNLQKTETLLWLFPMVGYYKDTIRTEYPGGYHGVSLRIAKGVYYRVGGFRGQPKKC